MNRSLFAGLRATAFALAATTVLSVSAVPGALGQSASLKAKAVDASGISRSVRGGSVSVIVEFRQPAAARAALDSGADASAVTSAVHAEQDKILAETFGASRLASSRRIDRMDISPMFAFTGSLADVEALAAHPDVVRIHVNAQEETQLAQSVPLTGMTQAAMLPFVGTNQIVAVIDTGVLKTHTFLLNKVVSEACYSNNGAAGSNSTCPGGVASSTAVGSGAPCDLGRADDCFHGTHVAGIAAGKRASGSPSRGMAPNAQIIAINVATYTGGSRVTIFNSDMIKALERVFAVRNAFGARKVASINISIGGGNFLAACATDPRRTIITQLRNVGIATVISAGNNSNPLAVSAPACIPEAISVGATTDVAPITIADYSNRGPLLDVFAPGSNIISSVSTSNTAFLVLSGTSMAAPHVAGAFAALRQAFPAATVNQVEAALEGRGVPQVDPLTGLSKPRIRVDLARPFVNSPLLYITSNSPVVIAGPQGTGPFAPASQTRNLRSSRNTAQFQITGKPAWLNLSPLTGTATATAPNLTLTPVQANAKARPYGVFLNVLTVKNNTVAQDLHETIVTSLLTLAPAARNNNFAQAINLVPKHVPGQNTGATTQAGEKTSQFMDGENTPFGATVWWKIVFASAGLKTINTLGSDFDTTLCAYRGAALATLITMACNDFFLNGDFGPSQIQFNATAGTTYFLQLGGWVDTGSPAETGTYVLNVLP